MFGRVEKLLRKKNVISQKEEYDELYKNVGAVRSYGTEWKIQDYKELCKVLKKLQGIKEIKRIKIHKTSTNTVKIKMEQFYRNDDINRKYESITTRGKKIESAINNEPKWIELKREIKQVKIDNLKTLLEHYDKQWANLPELQFYKNIIFKEHSSVEHDEESEDECDCMEDDCAICI